ncbi:SulP family inorganic anion transporter [Nocardioides sambongensis]|uniref:SulP family inorganic anion transporter n=1 Tax=Nocardioides sambongensis TaxID=2589074 RepID=UPI0018C87D7D|nr:SulP family inorganic anion transporter [Nocardioides sambongensis]
MRLPSLPRIPGLRRVPRPTRSDANAGLVLGVESVPDGLASGLLAGVNPISGLYGYLFGMLGAAAFTSTSLMAVQATGAMALVVADTDLSSGGDPDRALFTLAMLTGVVMVVAGLLRGGTLLRFVPTAVMTGFVTAVGINIVLGQLANFTGYDAEGANRVLRALDLVLHPWRIDPAAFAVGCVTVGGIVLLNRTRLKSMGMVVAIVVGSALVVPLEATGWEVPLVSGLAEIPSSLPTPVLPELGELLHLLVPALSLAFVGLVQGAAVSTGVPNPDGSRSDPSRDFIGQGVGNIVAGVFRGMPVGGSMSATALVQSAGARTRWSLVFSAAVMAAVILLLGDVVGRVAMPALAALLIVVGLGSIKPTRVVDVYRSGPLQTAVMGVTLVLTLVVPLQYSVLIGVGLAIVLFVAEQSNRLTLRALVPDGRRVREVDPPGVVPGREVLVLQPTGQLFFASAPGFEAMLPIVTSASEGAVVVLRLRGIDHVGLSVIDVLRRYADALTAERATLKVVIGSETVDHQLTAAGLLERLGPEHVYRGSEWLGDATRRAHADGLAQIAAAADD